MTKTTKNITMVVVALLASILFAKIELPTITTFILLAWLICFIRKSVSGNITKWRKKGLLWLAFFIGLVWLQRVWGKIYHNVFNTTGFEQKVVLITGTASGIGKATAEHLIEQGHIVYGWDIQFEKNKFLDDIWWTSLDMDVTDVAMVTSGVAKIIEEQGRIDVLFNNAWFGLYGPIEEVDMDDVQWQFDVNVFGYTNLAKAVIPHMRDQWDGLIINNTSMWGRVTLWWMWWWYHSSKHALEWLSDVLRFELDEFGIDVVVVQPGMIDTNFGNFAAQFIEKYESGSNYSHLFEPMAAMAEQMENSDEPMWDNPLVIAEAVEEAMNAKNPIF